MRTTVILHQVIGETTIYLAEVQTLIKVRNLKYGVISRDNPIRFLKINSLKMLPLYYYFFSLIYIPGAYTIKLFLGG